MKAYTDTHVCRLCVSYACLFAEPCFEMLSHQGGSSARQQPHSKQIFIRKSIIKQTKQKPWTLANNIHLAKCQFCSPRPLLEALLCDQMTRRGRSFVTLTRWAAAFWQYVFVATAYRHFDFGRCQRVFQHYLCDVRKGTCEG